MKTTRRILLALVLTLAVAAVMSVCAFALDFDTDLPQGVTNESSQWIDSGYADVDSDDGWYLIAINTPDYSTPDGGFPTFTTLNSSRFYWNKTTGEAVWLVVVSNMSGDSNEDTVYSITNPTTGAAQKFYAYASCFVDVTNKANNTFKTKFAAGSTEVSQYVTQNATNYPIYESYITAGKASKQWSNVYVTAEAYAAFVAYKAELGYDEDAEVTDTTHQDLLVEWAYTNIAGYKNARNCQEAGASYRMAWVFSQLANSGYAFTTLEIRAAAGITPYFGTVGLVSKLIEAETILLDSKINEIRFTNTSRGLFIGNAALRTLAHVTYDDDMSGAYTGTVEEGIVNLSGFTTVTAYSTYAFSEILYTAGMTDVVWFSSIKSGDTEYAGLIDANVFYECKNLETVTLTAPLTSIASKAFSKCTALTTIDLQGGVASNVAVASNAFEAATQAIEVLVYDETSRSNLETALASASITNVTVTLVGEDGEDGGEDGGEEEEKATMPMGVTNTSDKWLDSGYTDVDNEAGWYLIATGTKDTSTTSTTYPTFAYQSNTRFYWNKTTGEAVWLALSSTLSANWGEETVTAGTKNELGDGTYFTLAWVLNKLKTEGTVFTTLEFRTSLDVTYHTIGLVVKFAEAETILFDSKISRLNITNTNRGLFINNTSLETFAHVTYKDDMSGDYTGTVTTGTVDLSGFKTVVPYSAAYDSVYYACVGGELFRGAGVTDVVWFDSLLTSAALSSDKGSFEAGENVAGYIDRQTFYDCKSLSSITLTAPLTDICYRAFYNCTSLTSIDLKGGVASGVTVDSKAFEKATQAITVYVYSSIDYARAVAAFASISNVTVVNCSETDNAITTDGYSIRYNDSDATNKGPALRAEFTLLQSKVDEIYATEGLVLADYGVVVFSANTLENVYGGDETAILADLIAGTANTTKIKMVSAANGPYVRVNADGDKTFAAAITGIPDGNYASELYTYAYSVWTNDGGETYSYSYVTYTSTRTGKSAHSLYDATVYAFKTGAINSQNFVMSTGVELWDILEKGAFSITDGEQKAFSTSFTTVNVKYEFDSDGKFTYLDLPLYAWRYGKLTSAGATQWNSVAHSLEETSSTNVLWSLLVDGDELVAVYRADPNAEGDAVIPEIRDNSYAGYAPFSSSYMTPCTISSYPMTDEEYSTAVNGTCTTQTIYSPILSDTNGALVKTLVIDYGVDALSGKGSLQNTTSKNLETIVYPEGVSASGYILYNNYYVQNVIYASASKTSLTAATQAADFGAIADLSGLSGVNFSYAFSNARKVENVIMPAYVEAWSGQEEAFKEAYAIKRVWAVGSDVPKDGTVDMTMATNLRSLAKNCFTNMSKNATVTAPTILLPESFIGVNNYAYLLKEQQPCSQVFGADMSFTVVLKNSAALTATTATSYTDWSLMAFYDVMQAAATAGTLASGYADNLNKLTFVCEVEVDGETVEKSMTIAAWRAFLIEEGLYTPES